MKKFLKWSAILLVGLAAVLILLVTVFGLRVELAGSGMTPIFSFSDAGEHYDELEQQRSGQQNTEVDLPLENIVWPGYRGPSGDGRVDTEILTDWPTDGLKPLWKQPIGEGYSTFVVVDDVAFTIEQRREQEVVVAYALQTGAEVWTHAWDAAFRESMGGDGPRAGLSFATSPEGGIVYALGAAGELRALRARSGEMLWRRNILEDAVAENLIWGMSSAPLVIYEYEGEPYGEMLVTLPGGLDGASVIAYDLHTGGIAWTALSDAATYAAPRLVELAGVRQILVVTARRVVGLRLDGTLLWELPWEAPYEVTGAQPELLDENRMLISSAQGSSVYRIERAAEAFTVEEVWSSNTLKANFSSVIVDGAFVYGLDKGILVCIEAATGERRWKGGRYGSGQMLYADGHLIVLTEKGQLALVRATPERHEEVAIFQAIEGKTWNHPVLADGILLVRNHREMAAFDVSP